MVAQLQGNDGRPIGTLRLFPKTMTPVGSGVLIQRVDFEEKAMTDGGLHVPEGTEDSWRTPVGLVVAVGPDVTQIKRGDYVLIAGSTQALRVKHAGIEYRLLSHGNILAVLDEPFRGKCAHGKDPEKCQDDGGRCRVTMTEEEEAKLAAGRSRVGGAVKW